MVNGSITVLVVDESLCASLLADRIAREDAIQVIGIAVDVGDAVDRLQTERPDVIVTEMELRDSDGTDAVSAFREASPNSKVVVLTRQTDPISVQAAFDAGCAGFLTKRQSPDEVVRAIRGVAQGDVPVEPALLTRLLATDTPSTAGSRLTPRERTVLRLFAQGKTYAEVAQQLSLSVNTVRNHAQRILVKLGAHSKLEAVVIARRGGLL